MFPPLERDRSAQKVAVTAHGRRDRYLYSLKIRGIKCRDERPDLLPDSSRRWEASRHQGVSAKAR